MELSVFTDRIAGRTSAAIADDIRGLVERGDLSAGHLLPPVRSLAAELGVNRNTIVAAYRLLAHAGLVTTRGRAGTRVAAAASTPEEGFARDTALRDVSAGNPDPALIPDASRALASLAGRPVLYGEPVVDPDLERLAHEWLAPDAPGGMRLTITNGAFDAVERLLAQHLLRDDAVGVEDPGFLATLRTVRLAGYRPVAIPVDAEGMTADGLRTALAAGVRAVVVTPRAQNPTGASLSERRAGELRAILADHPRVLVIADDHFSLLSREPFRPVVDEGHRRWALVRSVSKFLGPDMSLAVVASDPETAERLAQRLSPGTTWVSHLLQRLAHALLDDAHARETIARAASHYRSRNDAFAAHLAREGIVVPPGDGLTVWVDVGVDARALSEQLMRRGWLARTGDEFQVAGSGTTRHLRVTAHHLDDAGQAALARDIAAAREATG